MAAELMLSQRRNRLARIVEVIPGVELVGAEQLFDVEHGHEIVDVAAHEIELIGNPGVVGPDALAEAKAAPKKLNFASSGNGTSIHLSGEMFKQMTGVDIVHVPYKDAPQIGQAMLVGDVQISFMGYTAAAPLIQQGKAKALAVGAGQRVPGHPNTPTMIESGDSIRGQAIALPLITSKRKVPRAAISSATPQSFARVGAMSAGVAA